MVLVEGGLFGNRPSDHVSNSSKTFFYHEIPSFRMSTTEVSVQDFKQFCKETQRAMPSDPGWGDPKRPMVNITYVDAMVGNVWEWVLAEDGDHGQATVMGG